MITRCYNNKDIQHCKTLIEFEWAQLSGELEHDIQLYMKERDFFDPYILVVEDDDKIIGLCIMLRSLMTYDFYELEVVIVHPEYRKNGIASKLVNNCLDVCKNMNKGLIFVTDKPDFYRKLGFTKIYNYCKNRYIIFSENKNANNEI